MESYTKKNNEKFFKKFINNLESYNNKNFKDIILSNSEICDLIIFNKYFKIYINKIKNEVENKIIPTVENLQEFNITKEEYEESLKILSKVNINDKTHLELCEYHPCSKLNVFYIIKRYYDSSNSLNQVYNYHITKYYKCTNVGCNNFPWCRYFYN